tara:strand:- start:1262 stop:2056 length:795 start_codon:yes stop_codon:yes gene_type:complete
METKKNFKVVPPRNPRVLLPNIFTLVGVCIGLTSIKFAYDGRFEMAVIAIIVAGIIDGLDGRIARLIGGASKVGKELDSLTDVISFGVAPAFIMYFFIMKDLGRVGWLISLIYVVCVVLRLARFNITSNTDSSWKDHFFEGVPSPAGGVLVLMPLIYNFSEIQFFNINYNIVVPSLFLIISVLLISKLPTYSLKKIVVRRSTTIFLLFSIVLFFGLLLIFTFNTIFIASLIYLLFIPISSMHYLTLKKKFSTQFDDNDDHEDIL